MAGEDDGPLGFGEDPEDERRAQEARAARIARRQDPDLVAEGRSASGEPQEQPKARIPSGVSQYGWFIGVVGVLVLALITLNTLHSKRDAVGSRGLSNGVAPPFAAPLALSPLAKAKDNDVNVARKAGSGDAGDVAACSIDRPDVLNFCRLYEKGPVVLAFFAASGEKCVKELDLLDDVAARHPDVSFAAISIKGDLDDLRRTITQRRWRFPVGYDHDGILANAYGVAVCPQITYVRKGGRVAGTSLGLIGAAALDAKVRGLEPR